MIDPPRLPEIENLSEWDVEWTVQVISPREPLPEFLQGTDVKHATRTSLVISKTKVEESDPMERAKETISQLKAAFPEIEILHEPHQTNFEDGVAGTAWETAMPVPGEGEVCQRFVLRIDGNEATQYVVTAAREGSQETAQRLEAALLSQTA